MDKIEKLLKTLSKKERQKLKDVLIKINNNNLKNLDLKKLKKRADIYRVRKGDMRIIFYKKDNSIKILTVERRSNRTYKKI